MGDTAVLVRKDEIATLAARYADGVIAALSEIEDEQQLHEGLAGAFLSFLEDAVTELFKEELCRQRRIGMREN